MLVQRPGDWETIMHMNTIILPVPNLDCRVRKLVWYRDGDTAMAYQLWGGSITSPPLLAPVPDADTARTDQRTPLYSRPD